MVTNIALTDCQRIMMFCHFVYTGNLQLLKLYIGALYNSNVTFLWTLMQWLDERSSTDVWLVSIFLNS